MERWKWKSCVDFPGGEAYAALFLGSRRMNRFSLAKGTAGLRVMLRWQVGEVGVVVLGTACIPAYLLH